jgi:polyhydroxyalkanoate synthesis regulator phasin
MAGDSGLRDSVEKLGLAALGAVALTAERADALADELAARGGMRRDEARQTIEELTLRWKGVWGSGAALRSRGSCCSWAWSRAGTTTS